MFEADDILCTGHLLVTTRQHKVKVADMLPTESREIGTSSLNSSSPSYSNMPPNMLPISGFWLPLLARTVAQVTGVTDYNIVQNNGARAAQVVPHVHFHIIPRPGTLPELKNKVSTSDIADQCCLICQQSWTMFGRGQREELDDDEGKELAREMRRVLRKEVERMGKEARL